MFKQFFWKLALCVVPVLIAAVFSWEAYANDRFKLGVDLVGGTIIVYEIDTRKQLEHKEGFDPKRDTNLLADSLKRRIDPNDLYNIVIRPAGGEGRVEIVLPTGGVERADEAQKAWNKLLYQLAQDYDLWETDDKGKLLLDSSGNKKPRLVVPRGQVQRLQDRVVQLVQEKQWGAKLFGTPEARKALLERAFENPNESKSKEPTHLALLYYKLVGDELHDIPGERPPLRDFLLPWYLGAANKGPFNALPYAVLVTDAYYHKPYYSDPQTPVQVIGPLLGNFPYKQVDKNGHRIQGPAALFDLSKPFPQLVQDVKDRIDDVNKNKEIEAWFKQQAWRLVVQQLLKDYPSLEPRRAAFERIAADQVEELVGRVQFKGDFMGQAFYNVAQPLLGDDILDGSTVETDKELAKDPTKFLDGKPVREFVKDNYGPSPREVENKIEAFYSSTGLKRDITSEYVQHVKDLVSKVGSLEFRILANEFDDKAAIDEATDLLNNERKSPETVADIELAQNSGLPPPAPRKGTTKEPKVYTIKLRGNDAYVTYSWVELGMQERQQLGLNNNAPKEYGRGEAWRKMVENKAMQIELSGGSELQRKMLQGALFYKRVCKDRNLTEEERRDKKWEYFVLTRNPEINPVTGESRKIDGSYLVDAANQPDNNGRPAVAFRFSNAGGELFRDLTRKNIPSEDTAASVKRHLAIILDGQVMSAPTINSEISTNGQISGSFTNKEVDQLVNILRSGALPATLKKKPVSENTMGATLGRDTIVNGLRAILVAFVVVLAFMIVYYRFAGVVASVALLANLVLTVGFMAAVKATFTLPGLAGLVLMLGMAVDANILIYERLREEREKGASILVALRNGYDRAFGTIIDTHLSSIFTAVVLYIVGNDQLRGFGVSLTVGLLISLFTSLYMTRVIFDFWAAMGWLKKLSMFRFFSRPDIDFMSIRYYMFAATGVLTILGGALFIGRLPNDLNIDFVGGTAYSGQLVETQGKTIEELRELMDDANQKKRLGGAKAEEVNAAEHIYKVTYSDSTPRTVTLANPPVGASKEEREASVAARATELPDWTVEQIFPSAPNLQEADRNRSRFFTVRTKEKEQELVQAAVDQLLQYQDKDGKWKALLKKVQMEYKPDLLKSSKYRETRISFYENTANDQKGEPTRASPSFVTTLLARELMTKYKVNDRSKLPFTFELTSEDQNEDDTGDGRFKVGLLTFTPRGASFDEEDRKKIQESLDETAKVFKNNPQPESLQTFDSQLAAETRLRAMYAILLSWAAILLYLWFRFGSWTFGLAAVLCLIHDLFFTLGIIAACHYVNMVFPGFLGIEDFKIDLPAVAALLTLVGYSVNDTIVVFDRIREVRGKNPDLTPQMINDSVNQTLSRTLLASLATWLVVIVLYVAGGPGVHLFAFVMVVGVVVGTYSSIYVASPLLLLFGEGHRATARAAAAAASAPEAGPDTRIQPAAQ
jgi:SecD/SecF fusion protein